MLTEDEARKKWCPESLRTNGKVAINRAAHGSAADEPRCIASQCMAWRWTRGNLYRRVDPTENNGTDFLQITGTGYCGKAGRP